MQKTLPEVAGPWDYFAKAAPREHCTISFSVEKAYYDKFEEPPIK